ncbi:hypothetical protein [Sandaracinus amylolyticus]|nr:hypothetical protein [Sandaracinus amylolyticus]
MNLVPDAPSAETSAHAMIDGEDESARAARRARSWTPIGRGWPR